MRGIQDLVSIRHGQSEGNLAHYEADQNANVDYFTNEFRDVPGVRWRLTEHGHEQVAVAGKWIVDNVLPELERASFDEAFTSPYTRAIQTAAGLAIPGIIWNEPEPKIRERDWGDIESIPTSEYMSSAMFALNAIRRRSDYLNWSPPGGESIVQVMERIEKFLDDIADTANPKAFLLSTHGEALTSTRGVVEQVRTGYRLSRLKTRKHQKLDNTSIVWHTDKNPHTGSRSGQLDWYRIANPYNGTDTGWQRIIRRRYTNQELLELIAV